MTYVITGATGHVGNNLVRRLLADGEQVRVIVRKTDRSIENLPIEFAVGDVFDKDFLAKNIQPGDIVIHTAALIDLKNLHRQESLNVNYDFAKMVTNVCLEQKVKKYIYFSSVDCIYKEDIEIIKEPTSIFPDKHKSYYAHSKALATNYMLKLMRANPNLDISILYPSAIIGINDFKPSAIGQVLIDCIKKKPQFGIAGGYNFIDVEDLAEATINLAKSDKHGSYLLTGKKYSIIDLYNYANKCLGKKRITYHIPMFFVRLCSPFIPYLSQFVFDIILSNYNYDNSKAINELGLKMTPFEETMKKTIDWLKENY